MKALSVRQPYASRIADGSKPIEFRSWSTAYRGNLLICAAARKDPAHPELPTGVAVCVVRLDSITRGVDEDGKPCYCWHLTDLRPVTAFGVSGRLSLFDVILPVASAGVGVEPPPPAWKGERTADVLPAQKVLSF